MINHCVTYADIQEVNINFKNISFVGIFIIVFNGDSLNLSRFYTHLKLITGSF